jgi:hypothetical protein
MSSIVARPAAVADESIMNIGGVPFHDGPARTPGLIVPVIAPDAGRRVLSEAARVIVKALPQPPVTRQSAEGGRSR